MELWTTNSTSATPYGTPVELLLHIDSSSEIMRYVQLASVIAVALVGFVSNTLVVLLFYKRPTLRNFSNQFVLNLSISHLLQCILVLPTAATSVAADDWLLGDVFCTASGFLFTALNTTSVLSLLLIALDRNCAVNSPLHYSMTVTKRRTGILISITWLLGALAASPPLFNVVRFDYRRNWRMCTLKWKNHDYYSMAYGSVLILLGFMVPFLTTILVYASMFQAARDSSERARKHSVESTLPESRGSPPKRKYRRASSSSNQFFGEEWKAVRTGFLVVTTFTLCWLPYFTVATIETYFDANCDLPTAVVFFVTLSVFSACVINPYLYVFRNKTCRKNIKQIACPSNLSKNKKWVFRTQTQEKQSSNATFPCVLAASLVNDSSEKVKALPALYSDVDDRWKVFSTFQSRSKDEVEETVSNMSDDDFFNCEVLPPDQRGKQNQNSNVPSIYNNSYTRNSTPKTNKLLLYRLNSSLTRDSTSSDTTENCSISFDSTNSNVDSDVTVPSRRGIGKYLFNTSEELWDSRPSHHRRSSSVGGESHTEQKTHLSSLGSARRKSFIHSHIRKKKPSETTLTSSLSNSSSSCRSNRPKLVRQEDTVVPPEDYDL